MPLDNNILTTRTTLQGRWHEMDWNWKVACQCCLRVPNQWPDSASWLPDRPWVSPKHALSAHFTRFLPDDLFVPVASEHSQCASGKKMVHAASQDAKMLIGSAGRMPVCHPLLPPYAVAQMLIHMLQPVTLRVCDYVCFSSSSFTEEYNTSIQEKLPLIIGSAAAGLVFLIAVVVIIIVCNRWVSPVSVPSSHRPSGPRRLPQETFWAFKPCSEVVQSLKCLFWGSRCHSVNVLHLPKFSLGTVCKVVECNNDLESVKSYEYTSSAAKAHSYSLLCKRSSWFKYIDSKWIKVLERQKRSI